MHSQRSYFFDHRRHRRISTVWRACIFHIFPQFHIFQLLQFHVGGYICVVSHGIYAQLAVWEWNFWCFIFVFVLWIHIHTHTWMNVCEFQMFFVPCKHVLRLWLWMSYDVDPSDISHLIQVKVVITPVTFKSAAWRIWLFWQRILVFVSREKLYLSTETNCIC